jgi:hypothetical protein
LGALRQIDDRQPTVSESVAVTDADAACVRPTVDERLRHPCDEVTIDLS